MFCTYVQYGTLFECRKNGVSHHVRSCDQRFAGVHFDIEFEASTPSRTAQEYIEFIAHGREKYGRSDSPNGIVFETIAVDVAGYYAYPTYRVNYAQNPIFLFAQAIVTEVDKVYVLSYSDSANGIFNLVDTVNNVSSDGYNWFSTSINPDVKPVMFAAETQSPKEAGIDPNITYGNNNDDTIIKGKSKLYKDMGSLKAMSDAIPINPSNTGLAIHNHDTWMNLGVGNIVVYDPGKITYDY